MRVYLAGPEVFFDEPAGDAKRLGAEKQKVCAHHGLIGVYPLDSGFDPTGLSPKAVAHMIARANEEAMRSCDLIIANMTPFRGPSMDVGTAFEMGFMRALGRPVFGYSNVSDPYFERAHSWERHQAHGSASAGAIIEDFGLADNLMMPGAIEASGGAFFSGDVPGVELYTNLVHFERAVVKASELLSDGIA